MTAASAKTRILLVEDDPARVLLDRMLLEGGDQAEDVPPFTLTQADCMAAALDLLSWNGFDVIILNPFLPDGQGLPMVEQILAAVPALPVIILTNRPDPGLALAALQAGAEDYLVADETDKKTLRRAVRFAVARRQSRVMLIRSCRESERTSRNQARLLTRLGEEAGRALQLILAGADRLGRHGADLAGETEERDCLTDIRRNATMLLGLADDLGDLMRLQDQTLHLSEQRCDLADLAHSVVSARRFQADVNGVRLDMDLVPGLPKVMADPARLRQALEKVLDNALKFTPPGGRVAVRVAGMLDGGVEIMVSDTGVGFADQDKSLLLRPFGRMERGGRRAGEGAGLGLPLAAALLRWHGGTLSLGATAGGGATVVLSLPASRVLSADAPVFPFGMA